MPREGELAAWLRLTLTSGLGGQGIRKLLAEFGLPSQVLGASHAALARTVGEAIATRLRADERAPDVEAALAWAARPGNSIITLADTAYPRGLLEIPDPPALLYVQGRAALLAANGLAVVGSRNATAQGLTNAETLARALSRAGLTIVSGLALGIDAAAHRGALDGSGSTVGVLVVEAALDSGSLITARLAGEQGRDVFAVPGSIHSPLSKGCHALIKQGAKLVESADDVLGELGGGAPTPTPSRTAPEETHALLHHLGYDPCNVDTLCGRSGLTAEVVSAMLLQLELEGKVASLPGGRYQRVANRDQN